MKKSLIKIGLISLPILGLLSLNSCRDATEIIQDGEITSEAYFTNVSNLNNFLQGAVYGSLDSSRGVFISSILTDELKLDRNSGGQYRDEYRYNLDGSTSIVSTFWLQNYNLILNVNRLLDGASKVTPSSSEEANYNTILAEARALRAFAYMQLLTYFSEDMSNDNALGVMIVEGIPTVDSNLPRKTNAEVYAVIESDLKFAEKYLTRTDSYTRANLNLVDAIKARVALYRGKHADAKVAAQSVISNSGLGLSLATKVDASDIGTDAWNTKFYASPSTDSYRNMWNDTEQGEILFAITRTASNSGVGVSPGAFYNTNSSDINGSPYWLMGRNLFNILNETEGDIRRYAYIDPTSIIDENYLTSTGNTDRIVIDKYPGKVSAPLRNDIKVFRLSEMYLILAEVAVSEGDLTAAANYVKQIRDARNYLGATVLPTYASEQDALKDILKERRVELAFEGHRYIDLKRLASKAGVRMDRNETDEIISGATDGLDNGHYKYTLPIPLSEISGNPNIQQNKGY